MTLKFNNLGHFAEEDSARYKAKITENLFVRLWKCPYMKGFRFGFYTLDGYELEEETGDYMSVFGNNATKKEAVKYLNDLINELPNDIEYLNNIAIKLDTRMREWRKNY